MYVTQHYMPAFFRGETLNRDTPVLVMDDEPLSVGLLPDSEEHLVRPLDET
jgi:hypothetical protein